MRSASEHLYLISGGRGRSDWVRNLQARPQARVRVGPRELAVRARVPLTERAEREHAVSLLHGKYRSQVSGTLDGWQRQAFIVALDPDRTTP